MLYQNVPSPAKITKSFAEDRSHYFIFFVLSLMVLGFTAILHLANQQQFQRFLGRINPLIVFPLAAVLGFVLLSLLLSQQWFVIYEKVSLQAFPRISGLAALFGIAMILIDTKIVFSADMNILFPQSLLFYPAIAFLVEILFHVLPLTLLLFIARPFLKYGDLEAAVWICFVIVAILEPVYQTYDMVAARQFPLWAVAYVGLHIFMINFCQLIIFKKYGFIMMYLFRLVYYLFWHISWGYVRLGLLF